MTSNTHVLTITIIHNILGMKV